MNSLHNFTFAFNFNELNLNTNTIQTLDSISMDGNGYDTNDFYGIVIYYKTGVLYANYWQIIAPSTYQSNLLAVDTSTGKLLFKDFQFCEGITESLAIDQTNGDIHFLNSTGAFEYYNTVDWSKWNVENNVTTLIQKDANTNDVSTGALVYNSLTNSLIELEYFGAYLIIYQIDKKLTYFQIKGTKWFMMTINSQTGDLIVGRNAHPGFELLSATVDEFRIETTLLCHFNPENYAMGSSSSASDFDYKSNTWIGAFEDVESEKYGGPYNTFFYVNIDTCDQGINYDSSNDNTIIQGIPRFNSGAASSSF